MELQKLLKHGVDRKSSPQFPIIMGNEPTENDHLTVWFHSVLGLTVDIA